MRRNTRPPAERHPGGTFIKISARNHFSGTITHLVEGPVSTEVTIEIAPKIQIVSVITTHSARHLGLKVGLAAHALIKADSVLVAID